MIERKETWSRDQKATRWWAPACGQTANPARKSRVRRDFKRGTQLPENRGLCDDRTWQEGWSQASWRGLQAKGRRKASPYGGPWGSSWGHGVGWCVCPKTRTKVVEPWLFVTPIFWNSSIVRLLERVAVAQRPNTCHATPGAGLETTTWRPWVWSSIPCAKDADKDSLCFCLRTFTPFPKFSKRRCNFHPMCSRYSFS